MKPKEGTILTVAKGGADKASELLGSTYDLKLFMEKVVEHMEEVLDYTPELLPVLKEAGVVDSGGRGLLEAMKGAYDVLCGKEVKIEKKEQTSQPAAVRNGNISTENISTSDIKFGYCTEFIILLEKEFTDRDEAEFKAFLESIGDSIVCVADDDVFLSLQSVTIRRNIALPKINGGNAVGSYIQPMMEMDLSSKKNCTMLMLKRTESNPRRYQMVLLFLDSSKLSKSHPKR